MANFRKLLVAVIGAVSLVGAGGVSVAAHDGGTLIEFDSMTPVTGAAVGTVNDRGIKGGGLAWAITSGSGEVDRQGNVEVQVTQGDDTVVRRGVAAGETLVTDGVDKLQPGMKVTLGTPGGESGNSAGGRAPRDTSGGGGTGKKKT